jgi:hypothetical protein
MMMDIETLVSRTNECDGGYQRHQPLDIFIADSAMLMFFNTLQQQIENIRCLTQNIFGS